MGVSCIADLTTNLELLLMKNRDISNYQQKIKEKMMDKHHVVWRG